MNHVRASVVIASRDRPDELYQCLQSVAQAVTAEDEIIVVDSASNDANAVGEVAVSAGARLIRTELTGSALARNVGIRHARGAIIAFTDDDARTDASWLNALARRFSDPAVAAVVGPVFELGSAPPAPLILRSDFDPAIDAVTFSRSEDDWFARLRFGAIGLGANLAIRRSAFEQHGLFRESLGRNAPISGDETYYLLTLVENGETVVNEPSAHVYHPAQSVDRLRDLERRQIAYLLYIVITRPRLRWLSMMSLIRRSGRRQPRQNGAKRSMLDLGNAMISAPGLLIAALRIDRKAADKRAFTTSRRTSCSF